MAEQSSKQSKAERRIAKKLVHYPDSYGTAKYPPELRELVKQTYVILNQSRYGYITIKDAAAIIIDNYRRLMK